MKSGMKAEVPAAHAKPRWLLIPIRDAFDWCASGLCCCMILSSVVDAGSGVTAAELLAIKRKADRDAADVKEWPECKMAAEYSLLRAAHLTVHTERDARPKSIIQRTQVYIMPRICCMSRYS